MAMTITAADRNALIRLASILPLGNPERRAILASTITAGTGLFNTPKAAKQAHQLVASASKLAAWRDWTKYVDDPVEVVTSRGTKVYPNLAAVQADYPDLDPARGGEGFHWAMRGDVKGQPAIRFESAQIYKRLSMASAKAVQVWGQRTAGHKMQFYDEMSAVAETVSEIKLQKINDLVEKATRILRINNIEVSSIEVNARSQRAFVALILKAKFPDGARPISSSIFQKKLDLILGEGLAATWYGVHGDIEFDSLPA